MYICTLTKFSTMENKNYRKIIVGDNFSNSLAYVVGIPYLKRTVKITAIVPSESEPDALDVLVQRQGTTSSTLWKTIPKKSILDYEFDINFE